QWLIGMLNPAAAFIKACKMIYDVVMFFIERGSQIMEFVNSILDGIGAIAGGAVGAAANLVEGSLAKILPLAISFLASLLGIGGHRRGRGVPVRVERQPRLGEGKAPRLEVEASAELDRSGARGRDAFPHQRRH